MTQNKYPRGSEWRKWDLHLHTPHTAKNDQFGSDKDVWEKYIDKLESNEDIAVLGITDYFSIENYLFLKQKQDEGRLSNKTLIPNVELRILPVTQTDTPINIHVLFNPNLPKETIEREFFQCLKFSYLGNEYSCLKNDLIALGRAYRNNESLEDNCAKKEGISQFNVSYDALQKVVTKASLRDNIVLAVSNSSRDGNSGIQHSSLAATRQEIYRMSHIIFSANDKDVQYFIGKGVDDEKTIKQHYGSLKPCVIGSDAHSFDEVNVFPNNKCTWIKADPTFEGLKQIIYEPESRVKIQADNPEFEKEKCPFTYIHIPNETKVFSEDDDIVFLPTTLPLNSSLVSIIGGRGTGKSQLINYLASAFNRNNNPGRYNLSTDITIGRKASVSEEATVFKVSEEPNAPFMYIAQSQIKELVEDKDKLSQNILETIGVTDVYSIPMDYLAIAETTVNEYNRVIKVLNADGKTILERKDAIQKEIKRYTDFIQNITSEQNRKKLEDYTKKVKNLHKIKDWQDKIKLQYDKNAQFVTDANDIIKKWNELFKNNGISIPLIDIHLTQDYLNNVLLARLSSAYQKTGNEIEDTKREFNNYKGDLTTLLSNVSAYQAKVLELEKQKALLEQEEQEYQKLSTVSFKELGDSICKSIDNYTSLINAKWLEFKGDSNIVDSEKKGLLDIILQKELEVEAEITLDTNRMYNLLLDKLDGRSYSIDKLHNSLNINTIDDFLDFVCQKSPANVFTLDKEDLRRQVLYLFYERYTDFISIGVKVTLNKKPITKLSFGQQGTIYLRLQIAAKMFSETIIYDQPEDDLDNDFISNELIPIFKKIKLYRQIIIVSHNANLVVNADSEQVIIANNTDGRLSYTSGSLEDPFINSEVCRVLEGGQKAFEDRERKYRLA